LIASSQRSRSPRDFSSPSDTLTVGSSARELDGSGVLKDGIKPGADQPNADNETLAPIYKKSIRIFQCFYVTHETHDEAVSAASFTGNNT
jgi:hypothetical protein